MMVMVGKVLGSTCCLANRWLHTSVLLHAGLTTLSDAASSKAWLAANMELIEARDGKVMQLLVDWKGWIEIAAHSLATYGVEALQLQFLSVSINGSGGVG